MVVSYISPTTLSGKLGFCAAVNKKYVISLAVASLFTDVETPWL
jgi:hypothetical protein